MWLAIAFAFTLELIDTSKTTRFDLAEDGAIVVPVMVEGQGPFRFLLDTGASQSIVSAGVARRLGAVADSRTTMVRFSGLTC